MVSQPGPSSVEESAVLWIRAGDDVFDVAQRLRDEFGIGPSEAVSALFAAGVPLKDGKQAVDAALRPSEQAATEASRDVAANVALLQSQFVC